MADGVDQEQSVPGGLGEARQPDGAGLDQLLRPILSIEVCPGLATSQRGSRCVGAAEIYAPTKARASIHALAGGCRATRSCPLCALEIRCATVGLERGSRMKREFHVRFYEGPGVKFPRATRPVMLFRYEEDARRVMAVLPKRFERYGLALHPDK